METLLLPGHRPLPFPHRGWRPPHKSPPGRKATPSLARTLPTEEEQAWEKGWAERVTLHCPGERREESPCETRAHTVRES